MVKNERIFEKGGELIMRDRLVGITHIVYGEDVPSGAPESSIGGYSFVTPDPENPGKTRSISGEKFGGTPFLAPGDIQESFGEVEAIRVLGANGNFEDVAVTAHVRFLKDGQGVAKVTYFVPNDGREPFRNTAGPASYVFKNKA